MLAGAASAGAFLSKYPSGAVLLAVVVVLAFQRDRPRGTRLAQGLTASATAVLVTLFAMPALYRRPGEVIGQIERAAEVYSAKSTAQNYFEQFLRAREVGGLLVVAALAGLFFLLRERRSRPLTVAWMVFAAVLVGSLLWTGYQPFRNVVPMVPYLGVAVAAVILSIAEGTGRIVGTSRTVTRVVALTIVTALCMSALFSGVLPVQDVQEVVDSRRRAREWLQQEADDTDRIVVAAELALLPSELDRLPGEVTVLPAEEMLSRDLGEFDIALWGRFTHTAARGRPLPDRWTFVRAFGGTPTPAAPELGRGSDQSIVIYER
jgi:hypothetical protein